jgi:NAD(P)H-dependent FMN reductase
MALISVIVCSTREGRFSEKPAHWILQHLKKRDGIEARLLQLAPVRSSVHIPMNGRAWSAVDVPARAGGPGPGLRGLDLRGSSSHA